MNRIKLPPSILGLPFALGVPILLAGPAGKALGDPNRLVTKMLGQFLLWVLLGLILALVIFWEKQPLRSIGLRPLAWQSVLWGLALAGAFILLILTVRSSRRVIRVTKSESTVFIYSGHSES